MGESNTITCLVGEHEGLSQTAGLCGCYCCSLCPSAMPSAFFNLYSGHLWNISSTRPAQSSTCVLITDTWRKWAMGHLTSVAFNPNFGLYYFFETLPSIANNAQVLTVKTLSFLCIDSVPVCCSREEKKLQSPWLSCAQHLPI